MITTVQCSICSQLNNKPRVVVTDFRLHHTCSIIIWLHSLNGVQPRHNIYKRVREYAHLIYVPVHYNMYLLIFIKNEKHLKKRRMLL